MFNREETKPTPNGGTPIPPTSTTTSISSLSYEQLVAHKTDVEALIEQLRQKTLSELQEKAASMGLVLSAGEVKVKRGRRTKAEIEAAEAAGEE